MATRTYTFTAPLASMSLADLHACLQGIEAEFEDEWAAGSLVNANGLEAAAAAATVLLAAGLFAAAYRRVEQECD